MQSDPTDTAPPTEPEHPTATAALHRDLAKHHWHEHHTDLIERYPADDVRCVYHQNESPCQHSIVDHSEPHTMADCPFKDSDTVRHVSVGPG